ncbi:MAG: cell wall-binding repeat-containing protein [Buchananella hordeovulneris]|nr:cell wall-binding repeat-containing protein [Buchananella hordeovulneris]
MVPPLTAATIASGQWVAASDLKGDADEQPQDSVEPAPSEDVAVSPTEAPAQGESTAPESPAPPQPEESDPSQDATPVEESTAPEASEGEPSAEPSDQVSPAASQSPSVEVTPSVSPSAEPTVEPGQGVPLNAVPMLLDDGMIDHDFNRPVGLIRAYKYQNASSYYMCTGTLIGSPGSTSSRWVLTARHCLVDGHKAGIANPTPDFQPRNVYFTTSLVGEGPNYRAKRFILDPLSDLALIEVEQNVSKRPLQVAPVDPPRNTGFRSYGYGPDDSKPNAAIRRNYTAKRVEGYSSEPGTFCGENVMTGYGQGTNIQGDSGGPAIDDSNRIVGVLSAGVLNGFVGPNGQKIVVKPGRAGGSNWVAASAIRNFVWNNRATLGFNFGQGRANRSCKGKSTVISASILTSTENDTQWSIAVKDGDIYYFHPEGATERIKKMTRPVVFNVRMCFQNHAGCYTVQDYILPKTGWRWLDASLPRPGEQHAFHAQVPKSQWVEVTRNTAWGINTNHFAGRPTTSTYTGFRQRFAGPSREQTAADVFTKASFPGGGSLNYAVITSSANFADAVVASPLAAKFKTGVLLTGRGAKLEGSVVNALKARKVREVFIVGSEGSVSRAKAQELQRMNIKVTRLGGTDRFGTSLVVGNYLRSKGASSVALMADNASFPDALSAGAAAGQSNGFVLLTKRVVRNGRWVDATPVSIRTLAGKQTKSYAVGFAAMDATAKWPRVKPIVGHDRYETAAAVARAFARTNRVVMATGDNFPDALAGGALAASENAVLVLVPSRTRSPHARVLARETNTSRVLIVGGPNSISDAQVNKHLR